MTEREFFMNDVIWERIHRLVRLCCTNDRAVNILITPTGISVNVEPVKPIEEEMPIGSRFNIAIEEIRRFKED